MLLDSHVVLWWVDGSPKLGADAKRLIEEAPTVHVSAATVCELTIKSMIGKLELTDDFESQLWDTGFEPLAVTPAHAGGLLEFPQLTRHDPFDRLLLSQAHLERINFFTVDTVLLDLDLAFVIDART